MSMLNVGLLQMTSYGNDQSANLEKGDEFCRRAKAMGADVALFPEMWNIGYTAFPGCPRGYPQMAALTPEQEKSLEEWQAQAVGHDSAYVLHFRELAQELQMAIAVTYLEEWPEAPRNTMTLIDRHGEIVLNFAKVHTCDFAVEAFCTPGEDFDVCTLDTASGPVNVGAMICYDREFPESARILMLKGAEVILTPNICFLGEDRIAQFRTRAFENAVGVAMANYAEPERNGHSVAFDGVPFNKDRQWRDMLVVDAGGQEGVYLAPFNLEMLREYRERTTWGNAYRRPHRYGLLTSIDVQEPFIRVNAEGEAFPRTER